MKAIIQNQYGDENTLKKVEVNDLKITKPDQILVDVHYANITAGDKNINTLSQPWFLQIMIRLIFGWNKPKAKIRGISGSGVVSAIGTEVNSFQVGDHVNFINSMKAGVLADHILLTEKSIISEVDASTSIEDAACIPFGFLSAYHFINEGTIKEGDDVYIYGASGAVGSAALSLAKHYGAQVVAIASTKHHQYLTALNPSKLIDYQTQDPFDIQERFDLVFDGVGKINKNQGKKLLKPQGQYLSIKSPTKEARQRLSHLNTLLSESKVKVIIDQIYDFDDYKKAHAHVYAGHKSGNVLIKIKKD
jgi:NADPH:quinone reductase-like Zn-dependent oxidoreductase